LGGGLGGMHKSILQKFHSISAFADFNWKIEIVFFSIAQSHQSQVIRTNTKILKIVQTSRV